MRHCPLQGWKASVTWTRNPRCVLFMWRLSFLSSPCKFTATRTLSDGQDATIIYSVLRLPVLTPSVSWRRWSAVVTLCHVTRRPVLYFHHWGFSKQAVAMRPQRSSSVWSLSSSSSSPQPQCSLSWRRLELPGGLFNTVLLALIGTIGLGDYVPGEELQSKILKTPRWGSHVSISSRTLSPRLMLPRFASPTIWWWSHSSQTLTAFIEFEFSIYNLPITLVSSWFPLIHEKRLDIIELLFPGTERVLISFLLVM